jgi:hypothetical protein
VQKFFVCANPKFHQLSGWLVSDDPAVEEARFGGPGLAWLHMMCGYEAGWDILPNSLKQVEKLTFSYLATAVVDIPAVSMTIVHYLKTSSVALCCMTKLHISEWPLIVPNRHDSRQSWLLSLFGRRSAVNVTGFRAIAAPPSIFHLFYLVFPHTWFTAPHHSMCIFSSVPPHICVFNCSLRLLCDASGCFFPDIVLNPWYCIVVHYFV